MLRASGVSEKGPFRPVNQDCFAVRDDLGLVVVADGMGGHNAGEVAAHLAVDAVVECVATHAASGAAHPYGVDDRLSPAANLLRTSILLANARVLESAVTSHAYAGMGTTVVAACIGNGRVTVAHVGDSRLYLFANGRLRQVTKDDSWVAVMLERDPGTDPLVLKHHPMRHALTNIVGARAPADVHVVEEPLAGGERLLLTTDGVHGGLDAKSLEQLLTQTGEVEQASAAIVTAALSRGSRDNCTAVVAEYAPVRERRPR